MTHEVDGTRCAGQVALVTGASRGIGAAIARRLGSEGARVACAARTLEPDPRYEGTLRDTVETIESGGGEAAPFQSDLSDADARAELVDRVTDELGPVDILVNNAAVTFFGPVAEFTEKRFRLMVDVQIWATIDLAQRVIPSIRERGGGSILNITSRAASKPQGPPWIPFYSEFGSSVYGLCKAALDRLSIGMAAELHDDGIRVNALAPWDNVATSGAGTHDLVEDYALEPVELMAQAALELVTAEPGPGGVTNEAGGLTGRVAYSQPLLEELGAETRSLDGGPFTRAG